MKVTKFEDKETWLSARFGKITGSKLKDIIVKRGNNKKIGYYQLIADRLGVPPEDENAMERGHRLEPEAIEEFEKMTGKKVKTDLVIWEREDNPSIAISPDGWIGKTEAVEVKCLGSARHIEALLTNSVPKDYVDQVNQYFIVNDDLKKLHFVMYDPRIMYKPLFVLEIKRNDVQADVEKYLEYQRVTLAEIDEIVNELSGF